MTRMNFFYVHIMFVIITASSAMIEYECLPGIKNHLGTTVPRGDILLRVGEDLEIFCHVNLNNQEMTGKNSSVLSFYRNGEELEPPLVSVVNESTIRLFIPNMNYSSDQYTCKAKLETKHKGLCRNSVKVAYPPQKVKNFSCVSENYENLKCTWRNPENNIHTNYSLSYVQKMSRKYIHKCGHPFKEMCIWNKTTDPTFPSHLDKISLELNGTNDFDKVGTIWDYNFSIYANVIPNKSEELQYKLLSERNVELTWKVPRPFRNKMFRPGLVHKVIYQPQWDADDNWTAIDTSNMHKKENIYTINVVLLYANTEYTFLVQSRSAIAEDSPVFWSTPAELIVHTGSIIPDEPPKTTVGSFESEGQVEARKIFIFWQQIPRVKENGKDFSYAIQVYKNDQLMNIQPQEIKSTYAVFNHLSYDSYRFVISSVNNVGQSLNHSEVFVPSREEILDLPQIITKIDFSHGVYELSWKPPKRNRHIVTNYTVFWCTSKAERPYPCDGYLDWKVVPKDKLSINITGKPEQYYQFAVAANSEHSSSGMEWASCTVIYNKVVDKVKDFWVNGTSSHEMSVSWRLDCKDRGIIIGYRIRYCPINIESRGCSGNCIGPVRNITTNSADEKGYTLTNLQPYTRYRLTLTVITTAGEGRESDANCGMTLQTRPSDPPSDVTITDVTNTSLVVSWLPPTIMNGNLTRFVVSYNNDSTEKMVNSSENGRYYMELNELLSYTNYTIKVKACTVACSSDSQAVSAWTNVGAPGRISMLEVKFLNTSMVSVIWGLPSPMSAPKVHQYEIQLTARQGESNKSSNNFTSGNKRMALYPVPDCNDENSAQVYSFRVRAINDVPEQPSLVGPWSPEQHANCFAGDTSKAIQLLTWGGVALGAIILFTLVGYMSARMWKKCQEMRAVEVKLPPGLAAPDEALGDFKPTFVPEHRFESALLYNRLNSEYSEDNRERHMSGDTGYSIYAMDEELLLKKKDDSPSRNPSGDSSGCVSGHDSVSSSLTTGTQLSSDSGTEADAQVPHAPSPDNVFLENPWDCRPLSLRLRNPSAPLSCGDRDSCKQEEEDDYTRMGLVSVSGDSSDARSRPPSTSGATVGQSFPNIMAQMGAAGAAAASASTPNLERAGSRGQQQHPAPTAVPALQHRASTGYISMPSSQESLERGEGYTRVGVPESRPSPGYSKVAPAPASITAYPVQVKTAPGGSGYVTLANATSPTTVPSVDNPSPSHSSSDTQSPKEDVTSYCKVGVGSENALNNSLNDDAPTDDDFSEELEVDPPSPSTTSPNYIQMPKASWVTTVKPECGYMPHSALLHRKGIGVGGGGGGEPGVVPTTPLVTSPQDGHYCKVQADSMNAEGVGVAAAVR